ncbi:hypothetical protein NX059_010380 [Plenodomus lindquistii]|nr:hypothetical protein NX059_010380 [Plenodomus lindquistii]
MPQPQPKNVVIVGGSLGGLLTGLALKHLRKDLHIHILERNPTPLLQDQGAGIVAGEELLEFFNKHDRTHTPLAVPSYTRLYLNKGGEIIDREERDQHMTSWDLLYHILRANFDGADTAYTAVPEPVTQEGEGKVVYQHDAAVTDIHVPPASSSPSSSSTTTIPTFTPPITLSISHTTHPPTTLDADLLIAANGPNSTIREKYYPHIHRSYAGYVAFRGTVLESLISPTARSIFIEKIAFFHTTGMQILAYTIPGIHGSIVPGQRLVNWVWYVNYDEGSQEYAELMTDKWGKKHRFTLPQGGMTEGVWERQTSVAGEVLPPQFAELVCRTKGPFVQAVTDVIAPGAVLEGGRVLLVGDALAGFRPHIARSTNQAALDALALAEAIGRILDGRGEGALEKWEKEVLAYARETQRKSVELGERSQFGRHPLSG